MGNGNFRPPTESTLLNRSPRIVIDDYVGDPSGSAVPNLVQSVHGGGLLGEWVKYNQNFIYLFMPFLRELTCRSNPSTDFRASWLKRRGLAQGCAFFGFVDMAPHLGRQIPQMNGHFQAKNREIIKHAYYRNNTASIPTKFYTVIKTTKCPSWVVQTRAQQI